MYWLPSPAAMLRLRQAGGGAGPAGGRDGGRGAGQHSRERRDTLEGRRRLC